jgi:hypothetical protein
MFVSRCKALPNKIIVASFPNMTSQQLIPSCVSLFEGTDTQPLLDVQCRISNMGVDIVQVGESYFNSTNVISLDDYRGHLSKGGDLQIHLLNKTKDVKNIVVKVTYQSNIGNVIFTNKYDHFEQVLTDVYGAGQCTRLVISFNRKIRELQLRPTVEYVGGTGDSWIGGLEIDVDSATEPNGRPTYTIDFVDDLAMFNRYLNFLQLSVLDSVGEDSGAEPLLLYVVAYGYRRTN